MATKAEKATTKKIRAELERLGGTRTSHDSLKFEGKELILPETMNVKSAISFLQDYQTVEEAPTSFSRTFKYRPWDGAHAVQIALQKLMGTIGIPKAQAGSFFFGPTPPELRTINCGPDETMQVPWGEIYVPLVDGTMVLRGAEHSEYGLIFSIEIEAPRKYAAQIEGLFNLIEMELQDNSIYRGKAFDGQTEPEFIDLSGVNKDVVIYSDEVMTQLEANIWSLLRYTDQMRKLKVPLKRAVLLEGPYGTGKTLAGYLTAQVAEENGWTTIYCRPERDDLHEVIQTARLYPPAVVFFEDVDTIASPTENGADGVTKLLDTFDGINAKGTELLVVLTTNNKEKIHKGMVRPGRLDAVIHIGELDESGIERMIRATVAPETLGDVDFGTIAEAMKGYLPAFVKEAIDRTTRYNIARNNGEITKLTTNDFVEAAEGLTDQLDLMNGAKERKDVTPLESAMSHIVDETMKGKPVIFEGEKVGELG